MKALVIAEHNNQALNPSTLNTITAASQLGDVDVLVIGQACSDVANEAAQLAKVATVKLAEAHHYADRLAEEITPLIVELAADYEYIVAPATSFGKNVAPRVAALLDVAQVSDITAIKSADTFLRPIYAGNAIASVTLNDNKKVITVRTVSFDATENSGSIATIETISAITSPLGLSELVENNLLSSERPDLATAKTVVSGGRGVGSEENFKVIESLADKLGAAVGASRAAVELYIAAAISGAAQHIAGMKDSKVIVAINKDPDAQIFNYADYGLIADLFDAIPEMVEKL